MFKDQHLLIICTVWPEPASSAAGSRMIELIDLFKKNNCRITIACDAKPTDHSFDLSGYGIEFMPLELNNSSCDVQLKVLQPTMVLFDRFMTEEKYGWRVAEQCPDAIRILDTEDLHCLRKARQEAFKLKRAFAPTDLLNDIARREIASIYRCDVSLIISPFEMNLLHSFFKIDDSLLHYIPFLLKPLNRQEIEEWPEFGNRKHFVTIGNFLHEPNVNSVLFLKEEIWPLIRKQLPEAELHIYGAYAPDKITVLNNPKQGFLVKGRALVSKEVVMNARVMLAPLRFGAGIKGKLVEAMKYGTPSITTQIGAEGMHGEYPWNGYIADDAEKIAEQAVELYSNETAWKAAQHNGVTIVNQFFSDAIHEASFLKKLSTLHSTLKEHRAKNFIGSILMHHSMGSTKYMSKWIELKNK